MWIAQHLALLGAMFLFHSYFAAENLSTLFKFPVNQLKERNDYIEFRLENTNASTFSICLNFKLAYRLNKNHQILLKIPNFITIGIYEDSVGGWLKIGKDNIIFDFTAALYPRTWNSLCIQQTLTERKIWHANQTIYTEKIKKIPSFNIKVYIFPYTHKLMVEGVLQIL